MHPPRPGAREDSSPTDEADTGTEEAGDQQNEVDPGAEDQPPAASTQGSEEPDSEEPDSEKSGSDQSGAEDDDLGVPGERLRRGPFAIGFLGGLGALLALFLGQQFVAVGPSIILVVVAGFLAAGLNPTVEFLMRRGLKRGWAVVVVILMLLIALAIFVFALVPVITDQIAAITKNAPDWLDRLQNNRRVQELDDEYQVIDKVRDYVADGDFASAAFGGVLGVGLAVLSTLLNIFLVVVLTLYFLATLPQTKQAVYRLAPASRRERVASLGDQVVRSIGYYVSGAFVVATCAGVSSLIFLFIVGMGEYAVALSFVVALLDVIPMIGATLGASVVTVVGFATDPKIGLACLIFYVIYQQVENYVIYPKVMSHSVDIPGAVIVIAALMGASLLGVVGALLAIPTAAAILMLINEVFIRRQDER